MTDMNSLVWMQFNGVCFYCGDKVDPLVATVDHFVPRSKGGSSGRLNAVLACEPCNAGKAALDPRRYGLLFPTAITPQQREGLEKLCKCVVARSQKHRRLPSHKVTETDAVDAVVCDVVGTALSLALTAGEQPLFDAFVSDGTFEERSGAVLRPIGAAWMRQGGVGLDLPLAAMPINGRVLLLPRDRQREPKA